MKNDIITLEITDITPDGYGVGRQEGKAVFVPDTAVGDIIKARLLKELKTHSFAKTEQIISPSPDRIIPECSLSEKCGGCVFNHISRSAEAKLKKSFVSQAFSRIGKLHPTVNDTVFSSPARYRNKVQYPFARGEGGKCIFGYYARRSHRIIEHGECFLQDAIFTQTAKRCAETADRLFIRAYDELTGNGILRHIVMRKNRKGELSVCLVVKENHKKLLLLAQELAEGCPEIKGIHININSRKDNVIFGDTTFCVYGNETLTDTLCQKTFEISPRSFYQVNAEMAEKLYDHAKTMLPAKKRRVLLDLYCGAGTIGICLAEDDDLLCGVEIIPDAVENAKKNAVLNGRSEENTLFVCGDASKGVAQCRERFGEPDVIIVDPPRKGLDAQVIKTVAEASPERIIYISCDPATLARDCAIFASMGYYTDEATPFDLFPSTGHIETAVCLVRRNAGI